MGQARWRGFVYGPGSLLPRILRPTVYTGWAGSAPFQPAISHPAANAGGMISATLPLVVAAGVLGAVGGVFAPPLLAIPVLALLWMLGFGVTAAASARVSHREPAPIQLRALVGVLVVLQPLARAWGRICGRALPTEPAGVQGWTGDRWAWLGSIERSLRAEKLNVRTGGSGAFWDLEVPGSILVAQITTAVAWGWEPRYETNYRLRIGRVTAALVVAAIAMFIGRESLRVTVAVLLLVVSVVVVTSIQFRSTIRRTLEATSEGADNKSSPPSAT